MNDLKLVIFDKSTFWFNQLQSFYPMLSTFSNQIKSDLLAANQSTK